MDMHLVEKARIAAPSASMVHDMPQPPRAERVWCLLSWWITWVILPGQTLCIQTRPAHIG